MIIFDVRCKVLKPIRYTGKDGRKVEIQPGVYRLRDKCGGYVGDAAIGMHDLHRSARPKQLRGPIGRILYDVTKVLNKQKPSRIIYFQPKSCMSSTTSVMESPVVVDDGSYLDAIPKRWATTKKIMSTYQRSEVDASHPQQWTTTTTETTTTTYHRVPNFFLYEEVGDYRLGKEYRCISVESLTDDTWHILTLGDIVKTPTDALYRIEKIANDKIAKMVIMRLRECKRDAEGRVVQEKRCVLAKPPTIAALCPVPDADQQPFETAPETDPEVLMRHEAGFAGGAKRRFLHI